MQDAIYACVHQLFLVVP